MASGPGEETRTSPEAGRRPRPFAFYFAGLIAIFVASAVTAVVYVQVQSSRDAERQARADATFAAGAAAKQLGSDIALLKTTVDGLAANPSVLGAIDHPEGCALTFAGATDTVQGHIDIIRPDGVVVCSSRKPAIGARLSGYAGEQWVRSALGSAMFQVPFRDSATDSQAGLYAAPASHKAVIAGFVDLASLGPALKAVYGGGRPNELLIVGGSGKVIARSIHPGRWVGSSLAGMSVGGRADLDGTRRIYASAPVPGTDWRLLVGEDRAEALAAGTRLRNHELAIVLASLALILLATFFVYRRTVMPVKRLSAGVKSTATRDHDAPVPVAGPAEVAALATEINALIASVNAQEIVREAKEEAERANEAKSRFLSHMSHELRTPLAAILGFAELLHRDAVSETKRTWSRHVLDGGRHLLELVNELLEISRIEAGRMMLAIRPVDGGGAVRDVLDLMAPLAAGRGIGLARAEPVPQRAVIADPLRLNQVLINLVSNAINYNRDAGTVTVSIEETDQDTVRFAIADTGAGIPADKLELLFDAFERLDADNGSVSGSGLGLAVTKGLVEAMGGSLTVASTIGVGTTFTVELPAAPIATVAPGRGPVAAPATSGHVLYIDDNPANLDLVEGLFADMRPGLELRTTLSGADGAELAEHERPDLLLLDLNLPDIAGEEVLRRLRARAETADVPVVILSADSTSHNVPRLIQSGADAYLTKPLNIRAFLDVVDRLLPPDSEPISVDKGKTRL